MAFSRILVALTAIAASLVTVSASPVGAVSPQADVLFARQNDVSICRYVLRTYTNEDLINVNLPAEFQSALVQAYNSSNPPGVGVDYRTYYEVANNGEGTWSWTWFAPLYDLETGEYWTGEAVIEATERLVGLTTKPGDTTWTIESAGCDPNFGRGKNVSGEGVRLMKKDQFEGEKAAHLDKRQEVILPECTFSFRPDDVNTLIGVDLNEETWHVWVSGSFENREDLTGVGSSNPEILRRNLDESWTLLMNVSLYSGATWELLPAEEIAESAVAIEGHLVGTAYTNWLIESVNCTIPDSA